MQTMQTMQPDRSHEILIKDWLKTNKAKKIQPTLPYHEKQRLRLLNGLQDQAVDHDEPVPICDAQMSKSIKVGLLYSMKKYGIAPTQVDISRIKGRKTVAAFSINQLEELRQKYLEISKTYKRYTFQKAAKDLAPKKLLMIQYLQSKKSSK